MAAQEYTLVSPEMFNEFLLKYQVPILSQFGLTAYGCCEDLTRKIPFLRQIPNLRRIAVAPFANVAACAEQIGEDYVISYRPSPADMVSYGLSPDKIRSILSRDLATLQGCHFDITLKDVQTVQGDPNRVRDWVKIVRSVIRDFEGN
jgi:ABC-type Zn uptake system ZnuABC Zn-binding protein ZnuA